MYPSFASTNQETILNIPCRGTTVALYLPRSDAGRTVEADRGTAEPLVRGNGEAVLIVEDDPDVRDYLTKLMKSFGYRAFPAADAMAARDALRRIPKIDLLISDIMLPGGIRGPQFAKEMLAQYPGTPVIFVSGRPSKTDVAAPHSIENAVVLSKPFTREEISEQILHALEQKRGPADAPNV